jgi:hypothetical protein
MFCIFLVYYVLVLLGASYVLYIFSVLGSCVTRCLMFYMFLVY